MVCRTETHRASADGHIAVLDRLAFLPFCLDKHDAQVNNNFALRVAAEGGHVGVVNRLALPPYSFNSLKVRNPTAKTST